MPNADRVILKRCRPNGDLIAFLPDAPANPGRILSYMHIGQHDEASLGFMRECLPADPSAPDAVALLLELRSIGYAVKLCRRLPANWKAPT